MAIRSPGARLLRDVPLSFVKAGGAGKKKVDAAIALIPFIDFLLTVLVFLLMSFSASGEVQALDDLPEAANGVDLELAPIVAVTEDVVTLDGRRVADTRTLLVTPQLERVHPLVQQLEQTRQNWEVLHPGEEFPSNVIVEASRDVDYRALRKVMFSIAQAGYSGLSFAVRTP